MGIVQAVGSINGAANPQNRDMAAFVENAMNEEVKQAQFEGINDPDVIRERKLAARDKAIATLNRLRSETP